MRGEVGTIVGARRCLAPELIDMDKRPEEVLDVAIVGGGIAGTYAAYRLRHAKQRIGLFECSNRIGGRLFTYHLPCSPGINIELGGMRFLPQRHEMLYNLITELDLPVVTFSGSDEKYTTLFYLRGQHLTEEDIVSGQVPYALNAGEKENQHRIANYYLERLLDLKDDRSLPQRLQDPDVQANLKSLTFETALNLVASPEGKAFVVEKEGFVTHGLIRCKASALMAFRTIARWSPRDVTMTLNHGMSSLPLRLKECFAESSQMHRTFLNHRLISIRKTEGKQLYSLKFQLTLAEDDYSQSDIKGSVYETQAKSLILALPVPALESIQWAPLQEISFQRKKALIETTPLCKIFLAFNHPWWKDCDRSSSVTISDQIHIMSIDFSSHDGTFVLMASYTHVTDTFRTLQFRGKPIQGSAPGDMRVSTAMKDFLLDQLSLTFGTPKSKIPDPIGGVAKFWENSPSGSTGIQCWKIGLLEAGVLERVQQPMPAEDVYVVGSDVTAKHGFEAWSEGALRVVDEMVSRLLFGLSEV